MCVCASHIKTTKSCSAVPVSVCVGHTLTVATQDAVYLQHVRNRHIGLALIKYKEEKKERFLNSEYHLTKKVK